MQHLLAFRQRIAANTHLPEIMATTGFKVVSRIIVRAAPPEPRKMVRDGRNRRDSGSRAWAGVRTDEQPFDRRQGLAENGSRAASSFTLGSMPTFDNTLPTNVNRARARAHNLQLKVTFRVSPCVVNIKAASKPRCRQTLHIAVQQSQVPDSHDQASSHRWAAHKLLPFAIIANLHTLANVRSWCLTSLSRCARCPAAPATAHPDSLRTPTNFCRWADATWYLTVL